MITPILALDLGTNTGMSFRDCGGAVAGETWLLAKPKELRAAKLAGLDRAGDIRIPVLRQKIQQYLDKLSFTGAPNPVIIFEDVQFLSSQMQSQLWASFRTVVWLAANDYGFGKIDKCGPAKVLPVPVGTLKKFATGHGGATKEMMQVALAKVELNFSADWDDNQVDARWLRRYAECQLQ